jgi:hypothetical protein
MTENKFIQILFQEIIDYRDWLKSHVSGLLKVYRKQYEKMMLKAKDRGEK